MADRRNHEQGWSSVSASAEPAVTHFTGPDTGTEHVAVSWPRVATEVSIWRHFERVPDVRARVEGPANWYMTREQARKLAHELLRATEPKPSDDRRALERQEAT